MSDVSGLGVLAARFSRLQIALWASLTLVALTFLFEIAELAGLFTMSSDPEVELNLLDWFYALVGLLTLIVAIITIIFWCMWLHRAAKNIVEADVADFEYSPAWAVGWHFIPFANLFKPFEVMRKIWNASAGDASVLDFQAPIVNRWWAAWIISSIASNISLRIALQAESPDTLYLGTAIGAVSSVASFVAIPIALKMLEAITHGQVQRLG